MELQTVLETRRSIRRYLDQEVEDEKLRQMVAAAILAPSWKNSQVSRYHVVKNKDILNFSKSV